MFQLSSKVDQSSAENLTMYENFKLSTSEQNGGSNEIIQVKLNDLSLKFDAQLQSNNESIVSAKQASDEMYKALQAKLDSSTGTHKVEINSLNERSAKLETNLDSIKDNIISEITTAQSEE